METGAAVGAARANVDSRRAVLAGRVVAGLVLAVSLVVVVSHPAQAAVNARRPAHPVKLIFIHHSTGQAWLDDSHGALAVALRDNNYFVSDTNYGWGNGSGPVLPLSRSDAIGSTTDIGDWWTWFRGPDADQYMAALYAEGDRTFGYSRLAADPGGVDEIVMFKSCFPNSCLSGSASAPVPAIAENSLKGQSCGSGAFTVANAKGIYNDLLSYFGAHPEKLFVVIVAPPVTSPDTPGGRALANWLVSHWRQDAGYSARNVFVFDYYTVLTSNGGGSRVSDLGASSGNHHRLWKGAIQHTYGRGVNHLVYPSAGGDSHPNVTGDAKATAEFLPLLNIAYNRWKGIAGGDASRPLCYAPRATSATRGGTAVLSYKVTDGYDRDACVTIRVRTAAGALKRTLRLGLKTIGTRRQASFACTLARGPYRFSVYATDVAGNAQARVGSNTLVVR
jgi:hypothetical protein